MRAKFFAAGAVAASVLFAVALAQAATKEQQAVDDATGVIEHMKGTHDQVSGEARKLIHQAHAVLIVPELVKGGFIFGAQCGTGVMVVRGADGQWSAPAFYDMGAGSFGLQIGVEVSKVVLIVMNEHALHAVMSNKVKLGAEAGLALATIGAGGEASTTTHGGADIYVVAESKGLFGGVAIEGGVVAPDHDWDRRYYGQPVSSSQIMIQHTVDNPGADRLRGALGEI